jgi:PAS domain S-box-containing protein
MTAPVPTKSGEAPPAQNNERKVLAIEGATERKREEEVRARLAAVVESSDDAIVSKTLEGIITSWNRAAEGMFGYSAAEAVGQHITLIIPAERRAEEEDVLASVRRGEKVDHFETERVAKNGRRVLVSLTVSPVKDDAGHVIGASKVARDITERRKMETDIALRARELELANERLRESEERLHLSQQVAHIGTFDWNIETGVNIWTPELEAMHGLAPGGFSNTQTAWQKLLHPDDREAALRCVELALRTGQPGEGEWRVVWPNGTVHWIAARFQAFKDEAGKPVRLTGVNVDITQRKQAEEKLRESELRFRRFMQQLPGLAWIKDRAGRYVYANDAVEKAFGIRLTELLGRTDRELFPPETAAQFGEHDQLALDSETGIQTIEALQHPDGTVHHSLVSKFPIAVREGEDALVGGVAIDITERKQYEDALADADLRKNEFLAMLAHELRNPLAPIRNALEIMRRAAGVESSHSFASAVAMMERQVGHMVRLVDDLLDVGRISRGKIELRRERVELSSVVYHAVEAARPLCESMGHELTVTLPPEPIYLSADPTRLTQVVGNLLNNACKFTGKGGRIWLTVEGTGGGNATGETSIRVRDDGIGIAADQLPRIFDMFAQVESSRARSTAGLGIGLTLVRNLVELHGGTVEAHSGGVGQGSEFVVRLPILMETPRIPTRPVTTSSTGTPTRRILVVDDNRDAAESLALLLQLMGHETRAVYDGLEAVEAAKKFHPDVVLLDIGLPKLDGYQAAARIRALQRDKRLTLVALTGWGMGEDLRRSDEAGFDAHMVKPVEPDALMRLLAELAPH